jgi:hypothetical protein
MTTTVTHDEAMACADLLPGDFETTRERLTAYIEQQHSAAASTQALLEAAERVLRDAAPCVNALMWSDATRAAAVAAIDALRSALAAETSGRDGGGNG